MITLRAKMRFYVSVTECEYGTRRQRTIPPSFRRFDGLLSRVRLIPRFIALYRNLLPCGLSARVRIGHVKNDAAISQFLSAK